MPELPEVETIRRDLEKNLLGSRVLDFKVNDERLMRSADEKRWRQHVLNNPWQGFERKGKFLVAQLAHGWRVGFHLRMTGQLVLGKTSDPTPRCRMLLRFDNAKTLAFIDQRRFGEVWLLGPKQNLALENNLRAGCLGRTQRNDVHRPIKNENDTHPSSFDGSTVHRRHWKYLFPRSPF
jgi:formamidopyrimidine-DNA glycosylase